MGCGQCLKWRETGRKRRPAVKVHVRVHLHLAARQFGIFRESFAFFSLILVCAAASILVLPLRKLLARQPSPYLSHRIAHLPQRRARETIFARKLFHRAHRRVASLNGKSRRCRAVLHRRMSNSTVPYYEAGARLASIHAWTRGNIANGLKPAPNTFAAQWKTGDGVGYQADAAMNCRDRHRVVGSDASG